MMTKAMKKNTYTFRQIQCQGRTSRGMVRRIARSYVLPSMKTLLGLLVFFSVMIGICAIVEANWGAKAEMLTPSEAIIQYKDSSAMYPWELPEDAMVYDVCLLTQTMASQLRVRNAPRLDADVNKLLRKHTDVYLIAYRNGWALVSEYPGFFPVGWVAVGYLNGFYMSCAKIPVSEVFLHE